MEFEGNEVLVSGYVLLIVQWTQFLQHWEKIMNKFSLLGAMLCMIIGGVPLAIAYMTPEIQLNVPLSQMILIMLPAPTLSLILFFSHYKALAWIVLSCYAVTSILGWYYALQCELEATLLLGFFGIPLGVGHLCVLISYLIFLFIHFLLYQKNQNNKAN